MKKISIILSLFFLTGYSHFRTSNPKTSSYCYGEFNYKRTLSDGITVPDNCSGGITNTGTLLNGAFLTSDGLFLDGNNDYMETIGSTENIDTKNFIMVSSIRVPNVAVRSPDHDYTILSCDGVANTGMAWGMCDGSYALGNTVPAISVTFNGVGISNVPFPVSKWKDGKWHRVGVTGGGKAHTFWFDGKIVGYNYALAGTTVRFSILKYNWGAFVRGVTTQGYFDGYLNDSRLYLAHNLTEQELIGFMNRDWIEWNNKRRNLSD